MMKFKVTALLATLVLLTGMVTNFHTAGFAAEPSQAKPPLRQSEPVEAIVADLEHYIPEYMRAKDIPGVAIALIKDGKVVWTEGFGVGNAFTHQPISPETVFEVASNSKVVTAYIALRLVDQGLLSLDEPLNAYLPEPWLPASEYRDAITLRHVLSHSSGLGHGTISKYNLYPPGRGYSYSAIGYQYAQAVIEQVTGQSLERVAQEMLFKPLGMSSSSFVNRAEFIPRTANGHMHALLPTFLFAILYLVSLIVVGLIGLVILRIRTGRWRPTRRQVNGVLILTFPLSLLPAFILLGLSNLLEFAWAIALWGLILALTFMLILPAGRMIIARLCSKQPSLRRSLTFLWGVLILVGPVLFASKLTNLPIPRWPQTEADSAGSMRATVGDMAKFLIELSNPQYLSPDLTTQMQRSQISLSGDLSWGLGMGIQHSQEGDVLWQWGQHLDFQSIMIIYPEQNFGVVVCTNSDFLSPDVAMEIAHRALGGDIDSIRRGIRLEFNYSEGD